MNANNTQIDIGCMCEKKDIVCKLFTSTSTHSYYKYNNQDI